MSRTRKLDAIEIRVLGALMEKEQTTPDQYPMTINALIAACNQKTNREPVTSLSETEVVEALDRLAEDVLTWRTQGVRTERWQQSVDRRWGLDAKSKAIMTLLLLRGPQTPGELKTRSDRMHRFDSVDDVEEALRQMADGFEPLVCELERRPGQRETRWAHLQSSESDPRDAAAEPEPRAAAAPPPPAAPRRSASDERLEALETGVADLETTVATLTERVAEIAEQLAALRRELGVE